jgi:hypothetical protein
VPFGRLDLIVADRDPLSKLYYFVKGKEYDSFHVSTYTTEDMEKPVASVGQKQ